MDLHKKPIIIGALHLPRYGRCNPTMNMAKLEEYVVANCEAFYKGGMKTVYLQDDNSAPGRATEETISVTAALGRLIKKEFPKIELGIIVEAHDPKAPIAIAHACGADFVRIKVFAGAMLKATGIQEACGIEAVQYRAAIGAQDVRIFADAHDRTGFPIVNTPITTIANWVVRNGADAVILTGMNYAQSLEYLDACKSVAGPRPRILGGGATIDNIEEVLQHADGAVVSTSLMLDNKREDCVLKWDYEKVKHFMDKVSELTR